jgi:hypothetical protein
MSFYDKVDLYFVWVFNMGYYVYTFSRETDLSRGTVREKRRILIKE